MTNIQLKWFISDHVEYWLSYGNFPPRGEFLKISKKNLIFFLKLKIAIAQSIFKILSSSFFANIPIFIVEYDSAIEIGVIGSHGSHFWENSLFKGLKGGNPRKKNDFLKIFC